MPDDAGRPPLSEESLERGRNTRDENRAEGIRTLLERVAGGSMQQIARKYEVRVQLVSTVLSEQVKEQIAEELRAKVIINLIPMAMAVFEAKLKMGDLEAARYLVDNFGVAKRPAQQIKIQPVGPSETDIEAYRLERQNRTYSPPSRLITPGDKVN